MAGPTFSVDTHLFRELGALLVGRDSTALVELIKNAYDADAREVIVHGESLDDASRGIITVSDDGIGMDDEQFIAGFLRIASRVKQEDRRSSTFKRRYTGAKGVGRLAAHKLAALLRVRSIPKDQGRDAVVASIDWDKVEKVATLDEISGTGAVTLVRESRTGLSPGTTISLSRLRRRWTPLERSRFFGEIQTFSPPEVVLEPPTAILAADPLLETIRYRDSRSDPGFKVTLSGDLDVGEDYWQVVAANSSWVIEVDALTDKSQVRIAVIPTKQTRELLPDARKRSFSLPHPLPSEGPHFQARLFAREGQGGSRDERAWYARAGGVRVYMEGFRVLPYGEPDNDWLAIDSDYAKRGTTLSFLRDIPQAGDATDEQEALLFLRKDAYFGGVFLTVERAKHLEMLVNREGFLPTASFDAMQQLVRTAVHISVRVRAAARMEVREKRRTKREEARQSSEDAKQGVSRRDLREQVDAAVTRASTLAREARELAARGDLTSAAKRIEDAGREFRLGSATSDRLMTEGTILRVLASVGTQMAAFVHEMNSLLGTAASLDAALQNIRTTSDLSQEARRLLGHLHSAVSELRRAVERQASYLTDVTSPDARRRRSRQRLAERFDAAVKLIRGAAEKRGISIDNEIPSDLKSRPMFPAELTLVFSNLLSNAVKNAGEKGRIRATARADADGAVQVRIENTGVAVDLEDAERWFRPFETTTAEADPLLGQGMGMGLPITRNMLEEYGGTIGFVKPSRAFSTAVEFRIPA